MRRRACSLAIAALFAAAIAPGALADGDPASDVLLSQNVYFPYPSPPKEASSPLERSVDAAFAKRHRIKVAVIATKIDLGSVPSLFGKPNRYAKFLGTELQQFYGGPLLIVMPAGFGIYDLGRSTAAEERVLDRLPLKDRSPAGLVAAAAVAVEKLTAAGALASRDIRAPIIFPQSATVRPGRRVKLTFSVIEDSERARFAVTVYAGKKRIASLRSPLRRTTYAKPRSVSWTAPSPLPRGRFRYCVLGRDAAGNRSRTACAPLTARR
jgi:hypothetical protein